METSTLYYRFLPSELDASPVSKRIGQIALATSHPAQLDFIQKNSWLQPNVLNSNYPV